MLLAMDLAVQFDATFETENEVLKRYQPIGEGHSISRGAEAAFRRERIRKCSWLSTIASHNIILQLLRTPMPRLIISGFRSMPFTGLQ